MPRPVSYDHATLDEMRASLSVTLLFALAALLDSQSLPPQSVAILSFANQSETGMSAADPSTLDWIGESIAETLREAAGARGLPALEGKELETAFRRLKLKERTFLTDASILKIGESLDAEQIVAGTFEFTPPPAGAAQKSSGGSLRMAARVYDRRHMKQSSEFTETGALEDLPTLEAHLAWRALSILAPAVAGPEQDFRALRPTIRLDAEENYTRGLLATAPLTKERYFMQAARLDPRFAHPAYQLGQLHYARKEYRQAAEWLEKVGSGDIHYREANFLLGLARYRAGDYPGAQKAFQMIAAIVPLGSVYNNLAASESRRNLPQAFDDFRKALDGDPGDPDYLFNVGYCLWRRGDFAGAADRFRAVLDRVRDDEMATLLLGRSLRHQGYNASTDTQLVGVERLKSNYEERAWRQLKSLLESRNAPESRLP
jgi:tetratricopeptide (TPR) repeat protein